MPEKGSNPAEPTLSPKHTKARRRNLRALILAKSYALTTLPLRMQEVQTRICLVAAPTLAWTGRRLTFQRRLLTLWAWLIVFPNCGPLPQTSQTRAITLDFLPGLLPKHDFTGISGIPPTATCSSGATEWSDGRPRPSISGTAGPEQLHRRRRPLLPNN
jgi:hypothetical protein